MQLPLSTHLSALHTIGYHNHLVCDPVHIEIVYFGTSSGLDLDLDRLTMGVLLSGTEGLPMVADCDGRL